VDILAAAARVSGTDDVLLFVYGTLVDGREADHLMGGASFVGRAETVPSYSLEDVGDGHVGMRGGGSAPVSGELYLVGPELLRELDDWEAGGGFSRDEVGLSDGSSAQAYFLD